MENLPFQFSGFEKSPFQFFEIEKLPKEILPLILGHLSFADLIVAKNVCRRFNILCRPIIMQRLNNCKISQDSWRKDNLCMSEICQKIDRGRFDRNEIRNFGATLVECAKGIFPDYCGWFIIANEDIFRMRNIVLRSAINRSLGDSNIDKSRILVYFRKYFETKGINLIERYSFMLEKLCKCIILDDFQMFSGILSIVENNKEHDFGMLSYTRNHLLDYCRKRCCGQIYADRLQ